MKRFFYTLIYVCLFTFYASAQSWTPLNGNLYFNTGKVGVGTTTPATSLDITGGTYSLSISQSAGARNAGYFATLTSWYASNTGYLAFAGAGGFGKVIGANNYGAETSIYANNTERIRILNNGNVGIGTTTPDMPLTVKSNTAATQYTIKTLNNAGNYTTLIGKSGESGILYVGDGAGNAKIQLYSAGVSYLNGGDVGIGTTTPVAKLDVAGHIAINSHLYFDKSSNKHFYCIGNDGWDQQLRYVHYTSHKFYTNDASTPKMVIAQNGNVGIGTTTPTTSLDITGGTYSLSISQSAGARNAGYFATLTSWYASNTGYLAFAGNGGSGKVIGGNNYGAETSIYANNTEVIRILNNGNVGIGTTSPDYTLHLYKTGNHTYLKIQGDVAKQQGIAITDAVAQRWAIYKPENSTDLRFNSTVDCVTFKANGNVGIGTTNPTAKLAVNGLIKAHEVKVTVDTGDWPDFVFTPSYNLRSLTEVEQFINENNHLPDVPNQTEVMENGVGLGEMNAILLQKVEELTLYLIKQEKRIQALEDENKALKN